MLFPAARVAAAGGADYLYRLGLYNYTSILCSVLQATGGPTYAQHGAALAASPSTQAAAAQLLLEHALPYLASHLKGGGADWSGSGLTRGMLDSLTAAVGENSLHPAL